MSGVESDAAKRSPTSSSNNSNDSDPTFTSRESNIQDIRHMLTEKLTVNPAGHGIFDGSDTPSPTACYPNDDELSPPAPPKAKTNRPTLSVEIPPETALNVTMVPYKPNAMPYHAQRLESPTDPLRTNLNLTPPHQKLTMEEKWGSQNRYHATTLQRSKGGRQLPDLSPPNSQSPSGRSSPGR